MKLLFTFLIIYFSMLNAGEIQRIESIVNDISKLRSDYIKEQNNLIEMEIKFEEEKEKNQILHQDLKLYSNYTEKEKEYKNRIKSLENKIDYLNKSLKSNKKNKIKTRVIVKKYLNNQSIHEENTFPRLLMKEQYKTDTKDTIAYAYRVKIEANIYDAIDGKKIDVWEKLTSFTSNQRKEKWIKITGYFIDKVWRPSSKDMWVKSADTVVRDR